MYVFLTLKYQFENYSNGTLSSVFFHALPKRLFWEYISLVNEYEIQQKGWVALQQQQIHKYSYSQ